MFREMLDAKREFHHAQRRYPIGAEVVGKDETHFRVWAPKAREIDVVLEDGASSEPIFYPLTPEAGGYFSGAGNAGAGTRYRFRVNAGENFYPDPASRFQPEGPHRSSCVVDPRQFRWADTKEIISVFFLMNIWFATKKTNGGMRSILMDRTRDQSGNSSSRTGVTGLRNFSSTDSVSTRYMPFAIELTNTSSVLSDTLRGRQPVRARFF